MIGDDCVIANYCKIGDFSVIGNRNRIGHCAEFEGITFDQVSFTHYGEVFGVVGTATDIAAGVTIGVLRFDDLPQMQKVQGRTEYPEKFGNAVYFGDYSRTGIASLYMPGVKVGSNSVIGPAVLVEKDVPSHTLIHLDQQQLVKKNGELTVTAGDRNASMGAWPLFYSNGEVAMAEITRFAWKGEPGGAKPGDP
ncbi:hypothetical protein LJK87_24100 [Paenibacillus sp. P25]|nr:hypothetical protein LJK87_24100 [Paenibacillus sp. P25]